MSGRSKLQPTLAVHLCTSKSIWQQTFSAGSPVAEDPIQGELAYKAKFLIAEDLCPVHLHIVCDAFDDQHVPSSSESRFQVPRNVWLLGKLSVWRPSFSHDVM